MKLSFDEHGWEDYQWWAANDPKQLRRINKLINEALRTPYSGTGKPEQLKYQAVSIWSRRIDHEHRLVYRVIDDQLVVLAARYHYR